MSVRQRKIVPRVIISTEAGLASLERYPQHKSVEGNLPEYRVYPREIDQLPLDTFLIKSELGTGGWPHSVGRIVQPNDPTKPEYRNHLTPEKRLVYKCWQGGIAVRMLERMERDGARAGVDLIYRYIVMPGMAGYRELEGFKTLCDTRRAWGNVEVSTILLCRMLEARGVRLHPSWTT